MRQFFLIDPWLGDAKGHNYQYALDVAGAAEQAGYRPILGVLRRPRAEAEFPAAWQVQRVFPFGPSPRHRIGLDGRNPFPCDLDGVWLPNASIPWWRRGLDLLYRFDRRRQIAGFTRGCQELFHRHPPGVDDILLLPSVGDFEFLAAVRFWRDHDWTKAFDWHLLFHFNIFAGRDPEFAGQLGQLRRHQQLFRSAVDQIPEHRLHFYTTTPAVARQFDSLGIAIFHPLPYPTRKLGQDSCPVQLSPPPAAVPPLRVTLAGAMRREKGKKQLTKLVDSVWEELLSPGKIQLVLQESVRPIRQRLPRQLRHQLTIAALGSESAGDPLIAAPHPLDPARYDDLIRRSSIGLLAYDSRRYFSRASGVLCEMLSAGVPVLVPAGCWLADQIAEENYRHVDWLWRRYRDQVEPLVMTAGSSRETLRMECDEAGDDRAALAAGCPGTPAVLPVPSRSLLVRCDWPGDAGPGRYAEVIVESAASSCRAVLGARESGQVGAVFRFPEPVHDIRVSLREAFNAGEFPIRSWQLLAIPAVPGQTEPPRARIGLTFTDDAEIPELLAELVDHYPHYRRFAGEFARIWQIQHSPDETISQLASRRTRAASQGQHYAA